MASLLAPFISALFSSLFALFARVFIIEKAAKLAAWTVGLGLLAALFAALAVAASSLSSAISGMSAAHPSFAMGLGIAFNNATLSAVSAYMVVWIACQLYVIKKKAINVITGAG